MDLFIIILNIIFYDPPRPQLSNIKPNQSQSQIQIKRADPDNYTHWI